MEESRFSDSINKLKYIPQVFAYGMTGVNRKEFPKKGSGTANFVDGIPAIYSIAPSSGGKYVERADINGIGWLATQLQFYVQCGQFITFDKTFCDDIGGYPFGAILRTIRKEKKEGESVVGYESYFVMSLDENNMTNFNEDETKIVTDPTGKIKTKNGYWYKISSSAGDISTLTALIASLTSRVEVVEQKASKAYKYKGSKETKAELETITGAEEGDVYNVKDTGDNYAYVKDEITEGGKKTHWDSLGKVFDLTDVYTAIKTAKSEAKSDAQKDAEEQIETKCVVKDNVKNELKKDTELGQNDIYNALYLNTLISDSAVTGDSKKVRGYSARYIDTAIVDLEGKIEAGGGAISDAYKAADQALKTELEGKITTLSGQCVKTTDVVSTKSTLETAIYNAVYVNAIEAKAQQGIDDAATAKTAADNAKTAADNAQSTADGAQTAASNAQTTANGAQTAAEGAQSTADSAQTAASNAQTAADNAQTAANNAQTAAETAQTTAEGAKSYAEEQVGILLDRIVALENRLETCENLIRYYHGGSDAEG